MATCADAIVQAAASSGVKLCFANPGTTEMWLVSALDKETDIRSVLGLHEAVCSGACDGYARMAQQPAMCLLHLGPGLGNALCNLHNARRARTPMLVLVGDMATWHRAADPPLNMDIEGLADTVSSRVETVQSIARAPSIMAKAVAAAAEPKAPTESSIVTVILPHDLSWASVEPSPQNQPASTYMEFQFPCTNAAADIGPHAIVNGSTQVPTSTASPAVKAFIHDCAAALKACKPGKLAVYLGGQALKDEGKQGGAG